MVEPPLLPRRPQRAERRAVAACCEAARVAVRESARARVEQRGRVERHLPAALGLFAMELARPIGRILGGPYLAKSPGEVYRGRPCRGEHCGGLVKVVAS